jgi:AcrR family transcriptional regulator
MADIGQVGSGTSDTRARIVDAASSLFRRGGYSGTGLKRIAAESSAPFGSIYHFFPGGKEELAEHAIRTSGVAYGQVVMSLLDSVADPLDALQHAFQVAAADLEATDYADACPIAAVALEVASSHETLRIATADVFTGWVDAAAHWFGRWIPDVATAHRLAQSMIMLIEGGFLLSRSLRDGEPLLAAGRSMVELTRVALPGPDL